MCRVRWVALASCVLALLAAPRVALAQAAPNGSAPTYALSWVRAEGAEECPSGRVLMTEVERRLGRAVFDAAAERAFEVEVTRFGTTYRSDVYVRDAAGHAIGHRSLQSDEPGCTALLNATALAIALVIDPDAAAQTPAPTSGVAAFETPPEPAPRVAPPPPPSPMAEAPTAEPPIEMLAPPRRPRTQVTVALRGGIDAGFVPKTAPGVTLFFSALPTRRWGYALAASYAPSETATSGIGSIDVGLTRGSALVTFDVAEIDSSTGRFVLAAGPSLGAFHVGVREPTPVTAPGDYLFLAAELQADLQLYVTKTIFIELGGGALVPLRRQEFLVRGQDAPVWRQPLVSGQAFLGLGAKFP